MARILLTVIILVLLSGGVHAQTTVMKIKMKDGTIQSFDVADITKITFGTVTGVNDRPQLAPLMKSFTLFQNYPNPFNPTTSISYTIPRGGVVDVGIYDVAGRRVKAYRIDYSAGGNYRIEWNGISDDGRPLASGLYCYQVKFENTIVSRKMLYLK